jgi:hypothetical protein
MRLLLVCLPCLLLAATGPRRPEAPTAAPCAFGRGNPIPGASAWVDQFKCYQASGRRVSIVGSGTFEAGTVSGGVCITGVAPDRFQVAPCGSFAGDSAMIAPYTAIAYVVDDPRNEAASIYLASFFRR